MVRSLHQGLVYRVTFGKVVNGCLTFEKNLMTKKQAEKFAMKSNPTRNFQPVLTMVDSEYIFITYQLSRKLTWNYQTNCLLSESKNGENNMEYTVSEYPREGSGEWGVFSKTSRTWELFGTKEQMERKANQLNNNLEPCSVCDKDFSTNDLWRSYDNTEYLCGKCFDKNAGKRIRIMSARHRHLEELKAIGFIGNFTKLKHLERRAVVTNKAYSNSHIDTEEFQRRHQRYESELEKFFNPVPEGLIVNSDPRGNALKLDSDFNSYNQEDYKHVISCRDWGGNGLLAPSDEQLIS